jgi:hypothetical protein
MDVTCHATTNRSCRDTACSVLKNSSVLDEFPCSWHSLWNLWKLVIKFYSLSLLLWASYCQMHSSQLTLKTEKCLHLLVLLLKTNVITKSCRFENKAETNLNGGVIHLYLLDFWTLSVFQYFVKNIHVSETGFISVLGWKVLDTNSHLGLLERANLSHWTSGVYTCILCTWCFQYKWLRSYFTKYILILQFLISLHNLYL